MPGMRLTTWSMPVSGIASTSLRVSTVVLTSSFSRSDPRPALTVTGGRVTGGVVAGGIAGGVSCALASTGASARLANAANVAARTDSMKFSPRQTNERDARQGASWLQVSGEGGWRAGLVGPVADADGGKGIDGHQRAVDEDGDEWGDDKRGGRGQGRRMGKTQAAFVYLAGRRHRVLGIVLAGAGRAHRCPQRHRHRPAVAHQRGMGERLQEIEGDRKQRRGESCRAPTRSGASAIHALATHEYAPNGRGSLSLAVRPAPRYHARETAWRPSARRRGSRVFFAKVPSCHSAARWRPGISSRPSARSSTNVCQGTAWVRIISPGSSFWSATLCASSARKECTRLFWRAVLAVDEPRLCHSSEP